VGLIERHLPVGVQHAGVGQVFRARASRRIFGDPQRMEVAVEPIAERENAVRVRHRDVRLHVDDAGPRSTFCGCRRARAAAPVGNEIAQGEQQQGSKEASGDDRTLRARPALVRSPRGKRARGWRGELRSGPGGQHGLWPRPSRTRIRPLADAHLDRGRAHPDSVARAQDALTGQAPVVDERAVRGPEILHQQHAGLVDRHASVTARDLPISP
jgi:hypothetical protein